MDFERQAREMMNTYAEVQQRQLQTWADQTKKLIDAQMKGLLDSQARWVRYCYEGPNPWAYLPTLMENAARHCQEMAEHNAQVSRQVLEGCIEAGQRFDGTKIAGILNGTLRRSVESCEEAMRKAVEAQLALLQMEEPKAEKKPAASAKRTAEEKAPEERPAKERTA